MWAYEAGTEMGTGCTQEDRSGELVTLVSFARAWECHTCHAHVAAAVAAVAAAVAVAAASVGGVGERNGGSGDNDDGQGNSQEEAADMHCSDG
jgi:hypothetical protein